VVVPHVRTSAAAAAAVAAAHYPPDGERGLATSTRAGQHGIRALQEHLDRARDRTLVMVQVEDAEALPAVTDICAVPGVDAVFIGPTDLSTSLGHPGELEHPDVAAAISGIARDVLDSGTHLSIFTRNEDEALAWRRNGAQLLAFAAPALIAARLQALVAAVHTDAPLSLEPQ
jgi:4-hydroxy-2-oxoheptanedioate aldolase